MKKLISINLIMIFLLSLFGCGTEKEADSKNAIPKSENSVFVYYPDNDKVVMSQDAYQLKQPDSIVPSVEEVMSVSMDYYKDKLENYSYMVDDENNVTLDITMAEECTREFALLTMVSVSDTMFQMDMVESVKITLIGTDDVIIDSKLILRNTIYHYGSEDVQNIKRVTLYKVAGNGEGLEALSGTIAMDDFVSMAENMVVELEKISAIPSGTKVNSISIVSGVCYLDLSQEFKGNVEETRSDLVVYSVVNSLTSVSSISKVMITIDGEVVHSYRGTVDLSKPLSFNSEIIK